jgi:hypothetical protein
MRGKRTKNRKKRSGKLPETAKILPEKGIFCGKTARPQRNKPAKM